MKAGEVLVVGRGKVGRTLARAWRARGFEVTLRAGATTRLAGAELLVLAVPDASIAEVAARLAPEAQRRGVRVAVHTAGAFGPDVLEPLRRVGVAVAQFHPPVSFADRRAEFPAGAGVLVQGDRRAVVAGARYARAIGLELLRGPLDPMRYHAAAALVSNGAVALVAAGVKLMAAAGLDRDAAAGALGPLLVGTGANVGRLGLPTALTGPVRRGNAEVVARHLAAVREACPELADLQRSLVRLQLEVARRFPPGTRASEADLAAVAALVEAAPSERVCSPSRRRAAAAGRRR